MRIAVIANVRTTQAATFSIMKALAWLQWGRRYGIVVVGSALLAGVDSSTTVVAHIVGTQMAINSLVGLALEPVSSACLRVWAAAFTPGG